MKTKKRVSRCAKCPFYRCEIQNKIVCEGATADSGIHLVFSTRDAMVAYKNVYCYSAYKSCIIARALEGKYEEEE